MREQLYSQLGEVIRRHRDSLGMSQANLAEKIGVGRTTITMMERGAQAIFVHQLIDIATALKSTAGDLLAEVEPVEGADAPIDEAFIGEMAGLLSGLKTVRRITR